MSTLPKLTRIRVAGFRSLRDVTLELTPVTILIGPNGAGKSNLLWALEMVRLLAFENLQLFVGERGGASFLLHYGPKETPAMELELDFASEALNYRYEARLGYGADESLVFLAERVAAKSSSDEAWSWTELGAGHRESQLREWSGKDSTARKVASLLRQVNFYHFHDTSRRSPLRTLSFAGVGGDFLRSDGSNLPAFLFGLRESEEDAAQASWRRIEGALRRVAPFISSLNPVADRQGFHLEWKDEKGVAFGPAHLSDGTLRALALITALWQPQAGLPLVSCIDEPELGLHPAAIEILCGLISSVATHRQVIVATQSPALLDHFEPDQIVVTERQDRATLLKPRLDPSALAGWLEDYTLSQLYDKNLLGGRP